MYESLKEQTIFFKHLLFYVYVYSENPKVIDHKGHIYIIIFDTFIEKSNLYNIQRTILSLNNCPFVSVHYFILFPFIVFLVRNETKRVTNGET